jgi:hypothetical protein
VKIPKETEVEHFVVTLSTWEEQNTFFTRELAIYDHHHRFTHLGEVPGVGGRFDRAGGFRPPTYM